MVEFDIVGKIRADWSKLQSDIRNMPKNIQNGMKTQIELAGPSNAAKEIAKGQKSLIAGLGKTAGVLAATTAATALLAKASPKFASSLDRLMKTLLLFFRPGGDLLSKVLDPLTKFLRDLQKNQKKSTEELGPEETRNAQITGSLAGPIGQYFAPIIAAGLPSFVEDLTKFLTDLPGKVSQAMSDAAKFVTDNFVTPAWNSIKTYLIDPVSNAFSGFVETIKTTASDWATAIYDTFIDPVVQTFKDWYTEITENIVKPIVEWFQTNITDPLVALWNSFKDAAIQAWKDLKAFIESNPIVQIVKQVAQTVGNAVNVVSENAAKFLGPRQTGSDYIPNDGMYMLHRGETVSRSSEGGSNRNVTFNFSPTINATIKSESDYNQLSARLRRDMMEEWKRLK